MIEPPWLCLGGFRSLVDLGCAPAQSRGHETSEIDVTSKIHKLVSCLLLGLRLTSVAYFLFFE